MSPQERLDQLAAGENPAMIAKLESGFAVMAENQFLPGYSLLLAYPLAPSLQSLTGEARNRFLTDMAELGDAVQAATGCKRVNYAIYGNLDPFLHAHVWPRYDWEDSSLATAPPLTFPVEVRTNPATIFSSASHGELLQALNRLLVARNTKAWASQPSP